MTEHQAELNAQQTEELRGWLARPNGSHRAGRVTFEAVAGGGIFVRTQPYTAPQLNEALSTRPRRRRPDPCPRCGEQLSSGRCTNGCGFERPAELQPWPWAAHPNHWTPITVPEAVMGAFLRAHRLDYPIGADRVDLLHVLASAGYDVPGLVTE